MRHKVLLADDEPSMRKLIERVLGAEAYELLAVSNGLDALKTAAAESPDIILLDIDMPRRNGLDVLRDLRRNARTRMIPVIMLSGYGTVDDEVGGLGLGADDYISKPFSGDGLKARVASALRRTRAAISANPLTRLPGSPMIEDEVARRISQGSPLAFLYMDIDRFKSYNDVYGFARGDEAIRETARLLMEAVDADGGDFLGHIGGDDFAAVTDPARASQLARLIARRFDERVPALYDDQARRAGAVRTRDREGRWRSFPLIALSIGVATSQHRSLDHYAKVVQIASEMKAYCKGMKEGGSRFAFDRRTDAQGAGKA